MFAAEKRMGFHVFDSHEWRVWYYYALKFLTWVKNRPCDLDGVAFYDYAFLTAPERCVIFILAAQKIQQDSIEK